MLVLQFTISQSADCTEFTFTDTTGTYNALTNPTGWGAPNDDIANTTPPCTLDITLPDGVTTYQIDLTSTTPVFPVNAAPNELILDAGDIGGVSGDKIPDGLYTFVYTVNTTTGGGTEYTQTAVVPFTCQVSCCVYSMWKTVHPDCDCCDQDRENLINAYLMLKALKYQGNCGNTTEFNNTLALLQRLCLNAECSNCK